MKTNEGTSTDAYIIVQTKNLNGCYTFMLHSVATVKDQKNCLSPMYMTTRFLNWVEGANVHLDLVSCHAMTYSQAYNR